MAEQVETEELEKLLEPVGWHLGWQARQVELQGVGDRIRVAYGLLTEANEMFDEIRDVDDDDKLVLAALLRGLDEPFKELKKKTTGE